MPEKKAEAGRPPWTRPSSEIEDAETRVQDPDGERAGTGARPGTPPPPTARAQEESEGD